MKRFLRFWSLLIVTCFIGISGVVTPARAESVYELCEKCSYAIWFYNNVSSASKCDDYANYGTSLNTLCRNTYNSSSNVTSTCRGEDSECVSGGNGGYCESGLFGSPNQNGNTCTVGSQTGTYEYGCCTNLVSAPSCPNGSCSSDSNCSASYPKCQSGCCQAYNHFNGCQAGTSVSTSCISGTVQTGTTLNTCSSYSSSYVLVEYYDAESGGMCTARSGATKYTVRSCSSCGSGKVRITYAHALAHTDFYSLGAIPCLSNQDLTGGTSLSSIYICGTCTHGYGAWTSYNTSTQKAVYTDCNNATRTTYYQCKKGYYSKAGLAQSTSASALNCQKCGTACGVQTTSDEGSTSIGDCCISSGSGSDSTGSFSITKEVCMS